MFVQSVLLPVTIELKTSSYRFSTTVTIVHTESDLVVIDTGFPDTGLEKEMQRLGFRPEDVSIVFNTHFHVDHFGGNRLFKNARIVLSRAEHVYQTKWHRSYLAAEYRAELVASSFPRLNRRETDKLVQFLDVVKNRYFKEEYFGDMHHAEYIEDHPSLPDWLEVVQTPGHTPHHLSYVLKGRKSGAIVTGDIVAARNAYMNGKVNFIEVYTDYDAAQQSIQALKERAVTWPRTIICPSHELPFVAADGTRVDEFPFEIS
jgi:glyoxylase-like metal-dependent hydrolase (beta-lactamase superfamily II)